MRVLLIKTSSMGDIIHTFPALTDAKNAITGIQFDWLIEESFAEMAHWHTAVDKVYPVAMRRWRKNVIKTWRTGEYCQLKQQVAANHYDLVLDAQGLFKSAWLSRWNKATVVGLDKKSAREPIASCFYQTGYFVDKKQHAVERTRSLFSQALDYEMPQEIGDYGLKKPSVVTDVGEFVVFLHGTTWPSKHWPEAYWRKLAEFCQQQGMTVYLPWGNQAEYQRACFIAQDLPLVQVLPRLKLSELAAYLACAKACVAVDTGLGHLTAAFDTPCISLYGPTLPAKVGAYGKNQIHLLAKGPYVGLGDRDKLCLDSLLPEQVIVSLSCLLG